MAAAPIPEERLGFLRDCLVEGDSAQEMRVRRNKRRALLISITVQILVVAALVLFPLFTKGENIAGRVVILPPVPYSPAKAHTSGRTPTQPPRGKQNTCTFCFHSIPPTIVMHDPGRTLQQTNGAGVDIPGAPVAVMDTHHEPPPPPPPSKPIRVSEAVIAARLVHRVEPVYPPLAIQTRREGRVELHAIISKQGYVESLEVVSGDPFFIQSSLAAVREWRYQPTILDGQPIEVDTQITVIYTLTH